MIVNRTKRAIKNTIAGFICKLLCSFAPFCLRSTIITKLGVEYLGLSGLFTSLLTMLSLSELGFSNAVVFALYKPLAENNTQKICELLSFYKMIYRIVGLIILVIGLILLPFLKYFIASDYPDNINIKIIFLIYLINTSLSYLLFAYKNAILTASMRSDIENFITTGSQLLLYIIQILILHLYSNYYVFVILIPLFTLINNIIRLLVVDKVYPDYKITNKMIPPNEQKDIFKRVTAVFGHKIAGVVFSSADSIVISSFLGLSILGKYSNYYYIYTAVYSIISIIFNSSLAVVGNSLVCRSKDENLKTYHDLFYLNAWLTGFCSCCFTVLYQPFIQIWLGSEALLDNSIPILLTLYFYVQNIRRVCHTYKDAAGMWQDDFCKPIVSAIFNGATNIILVNYIGLIGVLLSSIMAIMFIEMPWETTILFKKYFNISSKKYFKEYVGYTILNLIIIFLLQHMLSTYLPDISMTNIGVRLIATLILFNFLFAISTFRSSYFKSAIQRFIPLLLVKYKKC